MNHLKLKLTLRALIFGLPYSLLMVVGCLWLYEHRLFFPFVCATTLLSVVGWLLLRWIQSRPTKAPATPTPVKSWPAAGEKAWEDVDLLAARTEANPPSFTDANPWLLLFREVFDVVAKHFHPKSKQPAFEVTATDSLKVAELVARDLRKCLEDQVPGSDRITIHNIQRVMQLGPLATQVAAGLYNAYRLARLAFNPTSALVNEAQSAIVGGITSNLVADLPRMMAGYCVRRAGFYAIQLYSGQIALSDPEFAELGADKPLRIVVLGQTKAGKSSLINALFGEVRAATDVLPCTETISPYVLTRDGLPSAIVFDTIGFAGEGDQVARKRLDEELSQCDLIIFVCSARTAARAPDQQLLDEARLRFSKQLQRAAPPIVAALSHIDTVRPMSEWRPPYDFANGQSTKERNIRDAIDAVAKDLQLPRDSVIPVCLRQDSVYNVDEGLVLSIARVLPDGERAKLLRLLMESRNAEQRESLKRQFINAGLSLVQMAAQLATRSRTPRPRL